MDGGRGWNGCRSEAAIPSPAKAGAVARWPTASASGGFTRCLERRAIMMTSPKVCADPQSLGTNRLPGSVCKASCNSRGSRCDTEAHTCNLPHIPDIADIISAVEFDHTGEFLATGDRGGRIVLFEQDQQACVCVRVT